MPTHYPHNAGRPDTPLPRNAFLYRIAQLTTLIVFLVGLARVLPDLSQSVGSISLSGSPAVMLTLTGLAGFLLARRTAGAVAVLAYGALLLVLLVAT